ncbi:hypothetical protein LJC34_05510 [Oscillospiraceae bacterium OttesenSCG-928-G22]|nr:hypothetical protein [Oscillospiraceae bacterium OttesenSCG-928-G22]
MVVTIVGVAVSAIGAFAVASSVAAKDGDRAAKAVQELNEAMEASEQSIQSTLTSRNAELDLLSDLIPRIEELNGKTGEDSKKQAELNALVAQANSIIPDLIGGYNELTGAYDLNTNSIYGNIEALRQQYELKAEESRLAAQYEKRAQINDQIAEYTQKLADARVEYERQKQLSEESGWLGAEFVTAQETVEKLEMALAALGEQQAAVQEKIDGTLESVSNMGAAISSATESTGALTSAADTQSDRVANLAMELSKAEAAHATLARGQELTAESASALRDEYDRLIAENEDLIKQYPELVAQIDAGSTAQEQNAEVARSVAGIRRELLIQEVENQRDAVIAQIENYKTLADNAIADYERTTKAAIIAGNAANAAGKAAAGFTDRVDLSGLEADLARLDGLLDSLKSRRDAPAVTGGGRSGGGSSSRSSSKKEKTPEEEALERYKELRKALEYERDMEEISQEEFYEKLRALQTEYLEAGSDEWRKVNVEIYNFEKKLNEDRIKEQESTLKKLEAMQAEAEKGLQQVVNRELQKARAYEAMLDERYQKRLKNIDAELEAEKKRLNEIIENIDREIAARKRLQEEESYEKREARLQMLLSFERDDDNIANLEKELLLLQADREEWEYQNTQSDRKDAARELMEIAEQIAEVKRKEAEFLHENDMMGTPYRKNGQDYKGQIEALERAASGLSQTVNNSPVTNQSQNSVNITVNNPVLTSGQLDLVAEKALNRLANQV